MPHLGTRARKSAGAFHNRFGTAGVIVAVIALVVALSGSALAASGALTGKQKKEVEKIAKKYAGKPGAPGAAGTNGTNGSNGKDGAEGKQGSAGKDGKAGNDGVDGDPGKSVTVTQFAKGDLAACDGEGGATLEVEDEPLSETEVCNGEEGSPWTVGGTLPPGSTETGAWAASGAPADGTVVGSVSFSIPLAAFLEETHAHYVTEAEWLNHTNTICVGTAESPVAKPGELCVYEGGSTENAISGGVFRLDMFSPGASKAGAALKFTFSAAGIVGGSFAVTGCSSSLPAGNPDKCPA
jgi:hypothetical protein